MVEGPSPIQAEPGRRAPLPGQSCRPARAWGPAGPGEWGSCRVRVGRKDGVPARQGQGEPRQREEGRKDSREHAPLPVPVFWMGTLCPLPACPPLKGQMSGRKLIILKGWRL